MSSITTEPKASIRGELSPGAHRGEAPGRSRLTLGSESNVVFFGNNLAAPCGPCGAYGTNSLGHKFCEHLSCPIAIKEVKRRRRKRTSTLEQVYIPQKRAALED